MPDQYTLSVLERRERGRPAARPPPAVRRGLADQQPRALDADPAGARRLGGDRRWPGVLAMGADGRPAGRGLARSRAGAPSVHAGARLRAGRARLLRRPLRRRAYAPDPGRRPSAGAADHRRERLPRRADARDQRRSGAARSRSSPGASPPACGRRPRTRPRAWTRSATGSSRPSASRTALPTPLPAR